MATHYDPKRILQLLDICSWKNETILNPSGLGELAVEITKQSLHLGGKDISKRYINELYSEARKGYESEEKVKRISSLIDKILAFINITTWEQFNQKISSFESFISARKAEKNAPETGNVLIVSEAENYNDVIRVLSFAQDQLEFPIRYEQSIEQNSKVLINQLSEYCTKNLLVIWTISDQLNESFRSFQSDPSFAALLNNGQIIPIRVTGNIEDESSLISFIKNPNLTSGEMGLLYSLAAISGFFMDLQNRVSRKKEGISPSPKVGTINNSGSGTIQIGDVNQNFTGGEINLGTIINNHGKKED